MKWLYLFLVGLFGGVVGGMGMGGGTIMIPALTLFLDFSQKVSQGINLLVFIPLSVVALFIHGKNKLLKPKPALPMIFSGTIFAIISSIIAQYVKNETLQVVFGYFLILLSIFIFINAVWKKKKSKC